MKKKRGAILVGIGVLCAFGAFAATAYRNATNPRGRRTGAILDEIRESEHAAGVGELQARGCAAAMISKSKVYAAALEMARDSGRAIRAPGPALFVTCGVTGDRSGLDCQDIARAYVSAVGGHAAGPLEVVVRNMRDASEKCRSDYDEDGAPSDAQSIGP